MSGVNCSRENLTLMHAASDLTDSVFARPGTPSSNTWPLASRPMTSRSTRYCWPTMTLPSSLNSGWVKALASLTVSLMAEIPVFMFFLIFPVNENVTTSCLVRSTELYRWGETTGEPSFDNCYARENARPTIKIFTRRAGFPPALPATSRFSGNRRFRLTRRRPAPSHRAGLERSVPRHSAP